jgi:hypothetical protein
MDDEKQERQDGSQPERGTGQRQDHRAAPPGHRIPGEPPNLDDPEAADPAGEEPEPASSDSD